MGAFIVLEGCDCAGKTTQINMLKNKHPEFLYTKAPGGSPTTLPIREFVLSDKAGELCVEAEAFLFCADRAQHVTEVIKPALDNLRTVVSDRYIYSNLAYQRIPKTADGWKVRDAMIASCLGVFPSLTIFLDVTPEESIRRSGIRGGINRMDARTIKEAQVIRDAYSQEFLNYSEHLVVIIDTTHLDEYEVHEMVDEAIMAHLKFKKS